LAKSARQAADRGKQLYERIVNLAEHSTDMANGLDNAVEAYHRSVATLESRVLVSARRLRDLEAVPADFEIDAIESIERRARTLRAPEMVVLPAAAERP
jgi:DNA recombination protein RmuC